MSSKDLVVEVVPGLTRPTYGPLAEVTPPSCGAPPILSGTSPLGFKLGIIGGTPEPVTSVTVM